jgi:hypothetical protein
VSWALWHDGDPWFIDDAWPRHGSVEAVIGRRHWATKRWLRRGIVMLDLESPFRFGRDHTTVSKQLPCRGLVPCMAEYTPTANSSSHRGTITRGSVMGHRIHKFRNCSRTHRPRRERRTAHPDGHLGPDPRCRLPFCRGYGCSIKAWDQTCRAVVTRPAQPSSFALVSTSAVRLLLQRARRPLSPDGVA